MLYHVVKETHWNTFKKSNLYFSETFDTENFIHLSEAAQVRGVLERYYKNQNNLLILCIKKKNLQANSFTKKPQTMNFFLTCMVD
jgi:uncharacterized protein (DUF952 family)